MPSRNAYRHRARRPPDDGRVDGPGGETWRRGPAVAVGVAWLLVFVFYFSSSVLPNNPDIARPIVWLGLPEYFLDYLLGRPPAGSPPSGWRFFGQRFDLLAVAAAIQVGALAVGRLALRGLCLVDRGNPSSILSHVERFVFAMGLGLSALSLATLLIGLAGGLSAWRMGALLIGAGLLESWRTWRDWRGRRAQPSPAIAASETVDAEHFDAQHGGGRASRGLRVACLIGMAPFTLALLLGSMIPESDFDVKEYHLEGPKEYYLAGRISFLEHNVYTSFPFLTEMLSLLGMTLRADWWRGALAGKVVLASFGPLSAAAVFALARRIAGETAGWLGALALLSTPWTYRISIIAYAEGGLSFYLVAALLAATRAGERLRRGEPAGRWTALAGMLAGSAMACKYPGVLSVVIPLGAALMCSTWSGAGESSDHAAAKTTLRMRAVLRSGVVFSVGVLAAVGPWLLKNLIETGNPVYPLLYSLFGGRDWDAALNAQWKRAHSPADYDLSRLWFWITDVSARNDWLSPLLYGFAPLAWFRRKARGTTLRVVNRDTDGTTLRVVSGDETSETAPRAVGRLWLYVAWLFGTWWLFTHRLDRFWVPMLPVVAGLAGVGADAFASTVWRWTRTIVISACLAFNLCLTTSGLSGPNAYLVDLNVLRPRVAGEAVTHLNTRLPAGSKLLCVGAAEVFDLTIPYEYNTVFDRSLFERWVGVPDVEVSSADRPLRSADEIRDAFQRAGVTHVYVHWAEILRYRTTYGYTDFVTPARFAELRRLGILEDPVPLGQQPLAALSSRDVDEVKRWAPQLIGPVRGPQGRVRGWTTIELYSVRRVVDRIELE